MPPIFIAGTQHVLAIVTAAMMASTTNGRTTFATFLNINPPFLTVSYSMKCRILRNQPALLRGHGLHRCELLDAGPGVEPGPQCWKHCVLTTTPPRTAVVFLALLLSPFFSCGSRFNPIVASCHTLWHP
jgi:hypothetical protein